MTEPRPPGRPPFLADAKIIRISIPGELRERLHQAAGRCGVSEAEIVRVALEAELARRGNKTEGDSP